MAAKAGGVQLRAISPDATPEEVAAITAAVAASTQAASAAAPVNSAPGSRWVQATRISGRRAGYSRGEWRLSGRLGRRSRA